MMLFDSHAHYNDPAYDADRDEILSAMKDGGVGYIINSGCRVDSAKDSIALCEKYDFFYSSIGIHPCHAHESTQKDLDDIRALAAHPKVKAIGEIGLDYYWDEPDREIQKKWFRRQMEIAMVFDLPFIIHDRDAHEDCINILSEFDIKKTGGVMHCFSGSAEMARRIVSMGMMIALGGTVTFKNAAKTVNVAKEIPIEHIIIETDSPYLTPEPFRGKRNTPGYVKFVAQKIAEIKCVDVDTVAKITCENTKRLYKID